MTIVGKISLDSELQAHGWIVGILLVALAIGGNVPVYGAEVVSRGKALEGSVIGVTDEGVEFQTVYGTGTIVIPWADVEKLHSDKKFVVLYGLDEEAAGRILGFEDGDLLIGESPDTAERLPVSRIYRSITRADYEKSPLEVWRARYRYWSANYDLAFGYTDATTETSSISTGLELRRKRKPREFTFGAFYYFGTTKATGEERITNENRLLGRTRLDYDLSERLFTFGRVSAEYDEIQDLSVRLDPTVGVGYRFVEREKLKLAGRAGPGYVYQRYFGGESEEYFTILFGGDLEADLPYGSKLKWIVEYLPAIIDWQDNYLIRTTAEWTMPIIRRIDFKLSISDIYNSQPASAVERNSFIMTAGLSFRF